MCNINFPNNTGTSTFRTYSSSTIDTRTAEQKKKDLVTRLFKDDLITLDEVLVLLEKTNSSSVVGFGITGSGTTTVTHFNPNTPHTYTTSAGVEKELIN